MDGTPKAAGWGVGWAEFAGRVQTLYCRAGWESGGKVRLWWSIPFVTASATIMKTPNASNLSHLPTNAVLSRAQAERMNQAVGRASGSICLGFTVAGSFNEVTAKVIEAVRRKEPQVSLSFCVESRSTLIEAIADRRVQACFVRPPAVSAPEIRVDHLVSEPIMLAVNKHHRLAEQAEVHLSEAARESFVLWQRNPAPEIYDDMIAACQKAGFSPRVTYHAPQPVCGLLLVAAGIAVSLVPASLRSVHTDRVSFIPLTDENLSTSLALITRANEHMVGVKLVRNQALAVAARQRSAAIADQRQLCKRDL